MRRLTVDEIKVVFKASIDEYKKKMSEAKEAMQSVSKVTDEVAQAIKKASASSNSDLQKLGKTLVQETKKHEKLSTVYKQMSEELSNMGKALSEQRSKLAATGKEMRDSNISAKKLQTTYNTLSSVLKDFDIDDSINAELQRLGNTLEENKTKALQMENAMKNAGNPQMIEFGDSFYTMEQLKDKLSEVDAESEYCYNRLNEIKKAIKGISEENVKLGSKDGLKKLKSDIDAANKSTGRLATAHDKAKAGVAGLESKYMSMSEKTNEMKAQMQEASEEIHNLSNVINTSGKDITGFMKGLAERIHNVGNAASTLIHKFQNGTSAVGNFGRGALNLLGRLTGLGKIADSVKNKIFGFAQKTTQSLRMIKSMVMSMLLMNVFSVYSEGMGDLAKQSDIFNQSMSAMYSSLQYMKNSIVAAFQPLATYVQPLVTSVVNSIADAFNKLGELFAYISGQSTYTRAVYQQKNYAASVDKTTGSINDATAAAEEYKNTVTGFDEFTKLNDVSSANGASGSGSGSSGSNNAGAWVTETVNVSSGFADSIKNGDWTSVGKAVSDKLMSVMDSISWNSIYSKASGFGIGLANFLNGLFAQNDDGKTVLGSVGTTIAGALNTVLYSVFSFSKEFKWYNFGTALKEGINNFFTTYDFETQGFTVGNLAKGIATSVYAVVSDKTTWKNMGNSIGNGINGFMSSMNSVDANTGKNGWQTLGADISKSISGIATTFTTALKTVKWEDVGKAIGEFISSIEWGNVALDLGKLALEIIKALGESIKGLADTSPLATAIAGVLIALKIASSANLGTKLLNVLGKSAEVGSTATLSASIGKKLAGIALTVASVDIAISSVGNTTVSNTVVSTLGTAIGAYTITGSPKVSLVAGVATLGFKIGNALYENFDSVQSWADGLVKTVGDFLTGQDIDMDDHIQLKFKGEALGTGIQKEMNNHLKDVKGETSVNIKTQTNGNDDPNLSLLKKYTVDASKSFTNKSVTYNVETKINKVATANGKSQFKTLANNFTNKSVTYNVETKVNKVATKNGKSQFKSISNNFTGRSVTYNITTQSNSALQKLGLNAANQIYAGMSKKTIKLEMSGTGNALDKLINGAYSLKVSQYATGGFPEDGWFRANHGEIMGRFDNGQSVVANNMQIIEGIKAGVYEAVVSALSSRTSGTGSIYIYIGGKEVTDYVIKDINDRTISTGRCPIY